MGKAEVYFFYEKILYNSYTDKMLLVFLFRVIIKNQQNIVGGFLA